MLTDGQGSYRLQSIIPGAYAGLRWHIHFLVSAPGYQDLVTQWQLDDGDDPGPEVPFDFVLAPG